MSETFTIKIDGREVECKAGDKVLQVAIDNGIPIPHYCYHPGLTVAGNCRMCLCKSNKAPKPVISCATDCVPGLEIDTTSDAVKHMQEAMMEFLLINHPLDCPVCDQAGECRLQDYAHEYGRSQGRFKEAKRVKPATVVGPDVALWKQRCIACSRCIRFCDEVSGTGELRFLQRGDRVEIETFPGVPLDNPMAGNVVDICPVGALVSRDFLFEARVWNMKRQASVCPGCSKGCNVNVDVLDTKWAEPVVKRLVPRENLDVNGYWMCDFGRHEIAAIHHVPGADGQPLERLRSIQERVTPDEPAASSDSNKNGSGEAPAPVTCVRSQNDMLAALAKASERHRGGFAVIGNLWQTVEELHLLKQLADALGAKTAFLERAPGASFEFPGFSIPADKNPNRAGVNAVFGERDAAADLAAITKGVSAGEIKVVVLFGTLPGTGIQREGVTALTSTTLPLGHEPPAALLAALDKVDELFAVSLFEDAYALRADWILPGVSWAEKDGTYINAAGRLQRLTRAFDSPGVAQSDLDYLQHMLGVVGGFEHEGVSAAGIFKLAGQTVGALAGVSYPGRGSLGTDLGKSAGA